MPGCLVIKNDGIGDVVLASGLIAAIGERFGGMVDLVTCEENREIAEGIEPLRERLYVSRDSLRFSARAWSFGLLWPRMPRTDAAVLDTIRSRHYDVAICLRRFMPQNSLVIMTAVRADRKLCAWQIPTSATKEMAVRASAGWDHYDGPADVRSELSYAKGFVDAKLGSDLDVTPRLTFCHKQRALPNSRRVVLGLSGNSAMWPFGNWIELAMLLASAGWKLVLVGGNNVSELAERIVEKVPGTENQVTRLTLRETATHLESCDAFVGNDTGITHLASLVVRKCLVISGGGTFRRFFPWPTTESQTVVYHGLDCFDCEWYCKFSDRYCLSLIRPRDVIGAFETMMSTTQATAREVNLNPAVERYQLAWRRLDGGPQASFHDESVTCR